MRPCALLGLSVLIASVGSAQTPVVDFSAAPVGQLPEGWKLRGTSGYASRMAVQEAEDGSRHALLEYNFGEAAHPGGWIDRAGRKTCIMGCWLELPPEHWILEVDVEGDGSGHGFVLSVGEAGGREWFNYDLGRLEFKGRRTLTLDLRTDWRDSAGPNANRLLEPPLFLSSLNLEQEPGAPPTGQVRLHGVQAISGEPSGLAALSVAWFLPDGAAFTVGEDIAPHLRLQTAAGEPVAGRISWAVSAEGETLRQGATPIEVAKGEPTLQRVPVGDLMVGMYDCCATVEVGAETRELRSGFCVLPEPRADPRLRIGAGESYPGFTKSEGFPEFTARLARMGASWTLAIVGFESFDGPEQSAEAEVQRAYFDETQARGVAVVAALGNLSTDLVGRTGNTGNRLLGPLDELLLRHEAASQQAATTLRGVVTHWLTLHLDPDFFRQDVPAAGPPASYSAFIDRLRQAVQRGDPEVGLIAGLFDSSLQLAAERGGASWPTGIGVHSAHHFHSRGSEGVTQAALAELVEWKTAARIPGELWAECYPRSFAQTPGLSRFAEGLVRVLCEANYAAPDAHLLYKVHSGDSMQEGGLLDPYGNVNLVGVAFAICADLLREAEPTDEVARPDCRGYLFSCPQGALAALWPQPLEGSAKVAVMAEGPVEHYGACRRYGDIPAGTREVTLKPGTNLLRGAFRLAEG